MAHKKKKNFAQKPKPAITSELKKSAKHDPNVQKKAKIIVRNLPFANLSEENVKAFFSEYGNIKEVKLLTKSDGKFIGCGFIEFERRQCAAKAIFHANGKEMSGRPIVVDWALPKNTFVEKVQKLDDGVKIKKEDPDSEDGEEIFEFGIDKTPEGSFKAKKGESEEDDDDDDDGKEDFDNEGGSGDEMDPDDSEFDDDDDNDDDDDDDKSGIVEEEEEKKPKRISNDLNEGRTVFLKNVPFAATSEDVKKAVESYGPVFYALVCIDKLTEHSKGSAFVKFKDKESADKCIRDNHKLMIRDQPVEVTHAVSRDKLEDEKKNKKLKAKDSRNLYLVREGVIMAGSPAAATVSAPDMAKRLQIEQWKTQILRNLNMFVAKTRLVIHNLPSSYNDAKLRALIEKHSSPAAVVKEARVMTDRKKADSQGEPVSKELGFVTFTTHEDALNALRMLNNNPNIFTPNRRPIITFSIENREILHLKQKRMEKSRVKLIGDGKAAKAKGLDKMNKKQRRFLKRKEKIIKARQEAKQLKRNGSVAPPEGEKKKVSDAPSTAENLIKLKKPKVKSGQGIKKQSTPGTSKAVKRKSNSISGTPAKKTKVNTEPQEDYGGVTAEPGKKLKMRSRLKLKKQAEIHKQLLKERKKQKKIQKVSLEKKKIAKQREPTMKKKKVSLDNDSKFSNLIAKYKKNIENADSFKKWYA